MANKNIENRYTFEYVSPDTKSKKNSSIGRFFILSTVGIITLGLALVSIFPAQSMGFLSKFTNKISFFSTDNLVNKSSNTTITATAKIKKAVLPSKQFNSNSTANLNDVSTKVTNIETTATNIKLAIQQEELLKEITAEKNKVKAELNKLTHLNTIQLERAKKQKEENNRLTKELERINIQLLSEKTKNKKLNSAINFQDNKNNELAIMFEHAIANATASDKRYLEAITTKNINTSSLKTIESDDAVIVLDPLEVKNQVALEKNTQSKSTNQTIDYNNSINLGSTTSQVDAILATMQSISPVLKPSEKAESRKNNAFTATNNIAQNKEPENTDLLVIDLQNQINKLIQTGNAPSTSYRKSLNEESEKRKNAVRSIIVQKGETLWSIALRAYGNGSFFTKIIKANPHIEKNGKIVLRIGQVIHVPI